MYPNSTSTAGSTYASNTLPRAVILDNPSSLDQSGQHASTLSRHPHHGSSCLGLDNNGAQSETQLAVNFSAPLTDSVDNSSSITGNGLSQHGYSSFVNLPMRNWKRLSMYIFFSVIVLLVILNGVTTIWIMAQINFSSDGMGSLSFDNQRIKLHGQANFFKDVSANTLSSPQGAKLRIKSKLGTEVVLKDKDGNIVNKLRLSKSTVEALSSQLTIKSPKGNSLLISDDSGLKLFSTRLKITGLKPVKMEDSLQTRSVKCSNSPELSISSLSHGILIRGVSHVNLNSNKGEVQAASYKDLKFTSKSRKITFNSSWIELNNLQSVVATRSGRSYPNILSLCCCPNGNLFLSPGNSPCIAQDSICGIHFAAINDDLLNTNVITNN